jgi:AP-2 complex subunit alpha
LVNIFERYRYVLDAELQQRACEYLALTQRNDEDELLQVVCEEMPPFPERESALVSRLHSKADSTQDKRTWVIGGKDENKGREAARFRSFSNVPSTDKPETGSATASTPAAAEVQSPIEMERDQVGVYDMMGADPSAATDDVMTSLAGLDMGGPAIQEAPLLPAVAQPAQAPVTTFVPEAPAATTHISTAAALAAMSLTKGPGIEKVGTLHTFPCHNLTANIFDSGHSGSRD